MSFIHLIIVKNIETLYYIKQFQINLLPTVCPYSYYTRMYSKFIFYLCNESILIFKIKYSIYKNLLYFQMDLYKTIFIIMHYNEIRVLFYTYREQQQLFECYSSQHKNVHNYININYKTTIIN